LKDTNVKFIAFSILIIRYGLLGNGLGILATCQVKYFIQLVMQGKS